VIVFFAQFFISDAVFTEVGDDVKKKQNFFVKKIFLQYIEIRADDDSASKNTFVNKNRTQYIEIRADGSGI